MEHPDWGDSDAWFSVLVFYDSPHDLSNEFCAAYLARTGKRFCADIPWSCDEDRRNAALVRLRTDTDATALVDEHGIAWARADSEDGYPRGLRVVRVPTAFRDCVRIDDDSDRGMEVVHVDASRASVRALDAFLAGDVSVAELASLRAKLVLAEAALRAEGTSSVH